MYQLLVLMHYAGRNFCPVFIWAGRSGLTKGCFRNGKPTADNVYLVAGSVKLKNQKPGRRAPGRAERI